MRIFEYFLVLGLSSIGFASWPQDASAKRAAALEGVGRDAVQSVMGQYTLDSAGDSASTEKALAANGRWAIGGRAPKDCPQTNEACVSVLYEVKDRGVVCEWTVLLLGNGSLGEILGENESSAKYFLAVLNSSDMGELVLERKALVYPAVVSVKKKEAKVRLTIVVGADGHVERAVPEKGYFTGAAREMLAAATENIKAWRFTPFTVGSVQFDFNPR